MDRISDFGSDDEGSNPSGTTKKNRKYLIDKFLRFFYFGGLYDYCTAKKFIYTIYVLNSI
jgi:hypothetical protein